MANIKLIIADRGPHDNGKSTCIKKVIALLGKKYAIDYRIKNGDQKVYLTINNVLIGIESQGDPGSRMQDSLYEFIKEGCGIIFIACRNQGETINSIKHAHKTEGYEVIWAQNSSSTDSSLFATLNAQYAKWVANVIEQSALQDVITI